MMSFPPIRPQLAFCLCIVLLFVSSCASIKLSVGKTSLKKALEKSPVFNDHFTGFALYDPVSSKYLYDWNKDKYFLPASNTKLLTFYAGLKNLGDSIPGLLYELSGDTLYFTGTGDPTFLHPDFDFQPAFELLKDSTKILVYVSPDFDDDKLAQGWAWEDYPFYYQPERSGFPIYGNSVSFQYDSLIGSYRTIPHYFHDNVEVIPKKPMDIPNRLLESNLFAFSPEPNGNEYKSRIPFKTSDELTIQLLEDTLKREILDIKNHSFHFKNQRVLFSQSTDLLYAYMLKKSDNFVAEQIQYLCAFNLGLKMNSGKIRQHMLDKYFVSAKKLPLWKDGSGLSRYNLMTPSTLIELMVKINQEKSIDELKQLLAIGGVDGTIKNYYKPDIDQSPYLFAKTGSLSNNHCLTGIIVGRSGKEYFFSIMNNNYTISNYKVKQEMEKVVRLIYEKF